MTENLQTCAFTEQELFQMFLAIFDKEKECSADLATLRAIENPSALELKNLEYLKTKYNLLRSAKAKIGEKRLSQ